MSPLQTIKRLKVKVSHIKAFPFDVVYVVPKTAKDIIPRLFPYSLCVPFHKELVSLMSSIRVEVHKRIGLHQMEDLSTPTDGAPRGVAIGKLLPEKELLQSYCVVPVLSVVLDETRKQNLKNRHPDYLTNTTFRGKTHELPHQTSPFRAVFTEDAELITPQGIHNPICKICPRSLHHLKGECSLGEQICHESLIIRPDRRAQNREQLSTDGTDGDSSIGTDEPVASDT
jgi:hypothetical protein